MKTPLPSYLQLAPKIGELVWSESPSDELLAIQLAWVGHLRSHFKSEILELRQGFTTLGIHWRNEAVQKRFARSFQQVHLRPAPLSERVWEVPVCYDKVCGKDLGDLALDKRMSVNRLIELHSSPLYRIHFFGFLPGFMYLNGLPDVLHTPRKSVPDRSVLPGSVGIGGAQTGIYPSESPGGWHILGVTPCPLFDTTQDPPVWAEIGDRIQFKPISYEEMKMLSHSPTYPQLK